MTHLSALSLLYLQIESVKKLLDALESIDYAHQSPMDMIQAISTNLSEILSEVNEAKAALLPDYPRKFLKQLRTFQKELCILTSNVEFVRNAKFDFLPWSAIGMVHRLAGEIAPNVKIVLSGSLTSATYKIFPRVYLYGSDSESFAVLQIPHLYRRISLLHVLVAHELFHLRANEFVDKLSAEALISFKAAWEPAFQQERTDRESGLAESREGHENQTDWVKDCLEIDQDKIEESLLTHTVIIWQRMVTEIFCDLGCVFVFGPACLFALQDILLMHGDNSDDEELSVNSIKKYHPPAYERIKYVLEALQNDPILGKSLKRLISILEEGSLDLYANALKDRLAGIESSISASTERSSTSVDPKSQKMLNFARQVVEAKSELMWDEVCKIGSKVSNSWVNREDEIVFHLKRLSEDIPSGEADKNVESTVSGSHGAIGVAAWLKHLVDMQLISGTSEEREIHNLLGATNNLLLKSWDDAETIRRYIEDNE